jgi:hypothetical protein
MDNGGLRARAVVDRYGSVLVAALVVLTVLGGYGVYLAYAVEETETETRTVVVSSWESTGEFSHSATVRNSTRSFSEGQTLRDRAVYFTSITPVLDGAFRYRYTASESGNLSARGAVDLVVRSVDPESSREFWRFSESVASDRALLAPNDSLTMSFSRNVTAVERDIERERSRLGGSPGVTEVFFLTTVTVEGTRNGAPVEQQRTYRMPLSIESNTYSVNASDPVTAGDRRTERRSETVVVPPGPLERFGGPVALLVGLVGLAGFGMGRYREAFEVSDREREYLSYRSDRSEFDEWITEVRPPTDRIDDATVHVETTSLAGLVDLAIDTDRRVLETEDGGRYLVLDDDVVYSYRPPSPDFGESDPLAPDRDADLDEQLASLASVAETVRERVDDAGENED